MATILQAIADATAVPGCAGDCVVCLIHQRIIDLCRWSHPLTTPTLKCCAVFLSTAAGTTLS
jgi:hypothetical protein